MADESKQEMVLPMGYKIIVRQPQLTDEERVVYNAFSSLRDRLKPFYDAWKTSSSPTKARDLGRAMRTLNSVCTALACKDKREKALRVHKCRSDMTINGGNKWEQDILDSIKFRPGASPPPKEKKQFRDKYFGDLIRARSDFLNHFIVRYWVARKE